MSRTEIRVTGYGGQGVVLCAYIIGRSNAVEAGNHSTMIQSFGPEARGSACSATLVLDDEEILYPYIRRPDVLVAMSLEGYDKHKDELKPKGTLIYEKDLVPARPKKGQDSFGISSTRIAEGLGRTLVQNIVMLGFFAGVTRVVPHDQMREAVKASVPAGTEELNLKAFEAGLLYFEEHYGAGVPGDAEAGEPLVSPMA